MIPKLCRLSLKITLHKPIMTHTEAVKAIDWDVDVAQSEKEISFFKNIIIRTLLGVNAFFVLASFGVLGYFIRPTDGLLIFHYNVYFGVDIQGIWWQVFILPIASLLFLLSHMFLSRHFYIQSERIAAYLLIFGSCLMSIGIVIASASIVFINY